LIYYGAHTGRFSGDENINLQNLQRGSAIRSAIVAPPGYTLIAADLAQIEARIAACLAGQDDLVQAFREGRDVYSEFASDIYERTITKADKEARFVGKSCILGLSFGMGHKRFMARMHQNSIPMERPEAERIVNLYRSRYPGIVDLWGVLNSLALGYMIPRGRIYPWECLVFTHQRIILPNNMPIIYPDLDVDYKGRLYFRSRKYQAITDPLNYENGSRLWGGVILENICQALARIIVTTAELKLAKLNLPASLQVHDELVFAVPEQVLPQAKKVIQQVMETPVEWMPKLPINVEIKSGPDFDMLPALKDGDSLYRRSMSRTEKDI
jgi:DNA polymerase